MAPIQIHCCASAFPESRPKSLNHSPPDQTSVWVQKCKTYCPVDTCYTLAHILLVKHCQSTTNSIFVGTCGSKWVKAVTMRASRARRFVLVLVAPAEGSHSERESEVALSQPMTPSTNKKKRLPKPIWPTMSCLPCSRVSQRNRALLVSRY